MERDNATQLADALQSVADTHANAAFWADEDEAMYDTAVEVHANALEAAYGLAEGNHKLEAALDEVAEDQESGVEFVRAYAKLLDPSL